MIRILGLVLFLVLIVYVVSYQSVFHSSQYRRHLYSDLSNHHQQHGYQNPKLYMTKASENKAAEILQRRNKTEIFNVAYSDETDECGLDGGECGDTPKSWSSVPKPTELSSQVDDQPTPIRLEDDNDSDIEHTPKAWIKK